jgi:hypothetical protein
MSAYTPPDKIEIYAAALQSDINATSHRGASGLHGLGTRGFYQRYRLDEMDLLAMTLERLEP